MSWLSSIIPKSVKKAVTAATVLIPGLAVAVPVGGKKQIKNAAVGMGIGATAAVAAVGVPALTAAGGTVVTTVGANTVSSAVSTAKTAASVGGIFKSLFGGSDNRDTAPAASEAAASSSSFKLSNLLAILALAGLAVGVVYAIRR